FDKPWRGRGAVFAVPMERSARGCAGLMRLCCPRQISQSGCRLLREEKKEQPVRTFPDSSAVWRTDSNERIPKRYTPISQSGEGNVSIDAARILRWGSN